MSPEKCVILFLRYPEKGKVKMRLGEVLDGDTVLALYENFVLDILETLERGGYTLRICYTPGDRGKEVTQWLGKERAYFPQRGADLGERMKNAFSDAFADGYAQAVIVGSDMPDLPEKLIDKALQSDAADAVIGPSVDGGYYLIGFRRDTFFPGIFEGMPWGTGMVFHKTMEIFHARKFHVHVLDRWRDIDTIHDLREFFSMHRVPARSGSRTIAFLIKHAERMKLE